MDSIRKRAGGVCQVRKTRDLTIRISQRPSETALGMVLAPGIPVTWRAKGVGSWLRRSYHGQPSPAGGKMV